MFDLKILPEENSEHKAKLSKRELEVVFYVIRGKTAREIAEILSLSKRTVEHYLEKIKAKFKANTKSELIGKVLENNVTSLETKIASSET